MNSRQMIFAGVGAVVLAVAGVFFYTGSATTGQAVGVRTISSTTAVKSRGGGLDINEGTCSEDECDNGEPYECPDSEIGTPSPAGENSDENPEKWYSSCDHVCGYTAQICAYDPMYQSSCGNPVTVSEASSVSFGVEVSPSVCDIGFSVGGSISIGFTEGMTYTSGPCETCCFKRCFKVEVHTWECGNWFSDWTTTTVKMIPLADDKTCGKDCATCSDECCGGEGTTTPIEKNASLSNGEARGSNRNAATGSPAEHTQIVMNSDTVTMDEANDEMIPELLCAIQEDPGNLTRVEVVAKDGSIELTAEDWEDEDCGQD